MSCLCPDVQRFKKKTKKISIILPCVRRSFAPQSSLYLMALLFSESVGLGERGHPEEGAHASRTSDLLVGHLQELGVHVSGTLPLLVEQELVVAAVSTNGCREESRGETAGGKRRRKA